MLVRVVAPHFVAGLILEPGPTDHVDLPPGEMVCVHAAPILRWALGWTRSELSKWFRFKGWRASVVTP